jgi:hypothetical protein
LDAVAFCVALLYYFTILVLEIALPAASQSMHRSASDKIGDEMAGEPRPSGQAVSVPQNLQGPKIDGYVFWDQNLPIVFDVYWPIS